MPLPILALAAIQAAPSIIEGATSLIGANAQRKEIEEREKRARAALERSRARFEAQDITNPFANMTVNTQQAQFQADRLNQTTADTLNAFRAAAGQSGIAALAQSSINAAADATRKISADIGAQEAKNQIFIARGEEERQKREADLRGTLFGIDTAETTQAIAARAANEQQRAQGMGQILGGVTEGATSFYAGKKLEDAGIDPENIIKLFT